MIFVRKVSNFSGSCSGRWLGPRRSQDTGQSTTDASRVSSPVKRRCDAVFDEARNVETVMHRVHEVFRVAADRPVDEVIQERAALATEAARQFGLAGRKIGSRLTPWTRQRR